MSGWSGSDSEVVQYSTNASNAPAGLSGYSSIPLGSNFLSDATTQATAGTSISTINFVMMDYDHDYLDSAPSDSSAVTGHYYYNGHSTRRPYIEYTTGVSGYGNEVIGLETKRIYALDTDDVGKVIGLE